MNRPSIVSMPGSSAGLPETTLPKTTSGLFIYFCSRIPHAVCISVLMVTWSCFATSFIRCVNF
ncbi:hypothetical protein D3C77_277410 [compost metagenome]